MVLQDVVEGTEKLIFYNCFMLTLQAAISTLFLACYQSFSVKCLFLYIRVCSFLFQNSTVILPLLLVTPMFLVKYFAQCI